MGEANRIEPRRWVSLSQARKLYPVLSRTVLYERAHSASANDTVVPTPDPATRREAQR